MKIGERGQVTVPKGIRERFGLRPATEVEFEVIRGVIVLRRAAPAVNLRKQKGTRTSVLKRMGFGTVDEFIEAVRGR